MIILNSFILIILVIFAIFVIKKKNRYERIIEEEENEIRRINNNNVVLKDWLALKQKGIILSEWLARNNISRVVLYGYGMLGKAFYVKIMNSDIELIAIVDKNYEKIYANVPVVGLDNIPESDAIIVSVINYFDDIERDLLGRCKCPIISLEDIIYGVGYIFDE